MKNRIIALSVFMLAVLFVFPAFCAERCEKTVQVSGEAAVNVVPDEIVISFGVTTENEYLKKAKKENDEKAAALIAMAKAAKIADKDIQTDFVSLRPVDQYSSVKRKGFTATKNIVVVLRDVAAYESFVEKAVETGANNIYNVEFKTSELRKHRDNARTLAIKAAREKAMLMAKSLDRSIGGPLEISEQDVASAYNGWLTRRMGMAAGFQNAAADAGGAGEPEAGDTIALGQIKVTARVIVVFELK